MENNIIMLFLRKLIGEKIMVHEKRGNIVGTIAYNGNLMGNLFVKPSEQKKGIGTKLMKDCEDIISKKYDYAQFYSYRNAVPLHKKRGCKIKDKKKLLMVKKL